ncbi:hypothetical protein PIB30_034057 [Stylosanthes scabra]|uniref:Uncharacterized protein n=1 Tax=Stylosanthes scabra TaxID=79078 RepID=A0ABU6YBF9_9FABA|nr:hypothetical protein [Stylosanthes scabra]
MIGDMKSLESFDVSSNQLSGTIPSSMSVLTSLSQLNLSHNNFSGQIPTSTQFSTYDPSSYADNPYLSGFATGFWGVIGTLWFKKTWRHAYFRRAEDVADWIYVTTAIRMAKLKKWMMMMRNRVNV